MNQRLPDPLEAVLDALDVVLTDERTALRKLDAEGVSQAAAKKLSIEQAIARLADDAPPRLRQRLGTLRDKIQANQILLIHARNCIREAMGVVSGGVGHSVHVGRYPSSRPPPSMPPARLNLKG